MRESRLRYWFLNIFTYLVVGLSLFPLVWLLSTSLKSGRDAFAMPPVWIFVPTLKNFLAVLSEGEFLSSYRNSLIVGLSTTLLSLAIGIPAGYLLARVRTRLNQTLGVWIVLSRMVPPVAFIIPFYIIMRNLSLLDTYIGLVLAYLTITLPFVTWMMTGFFRSVPIDIEDAARIDGCNRFSTLWFISIPLALPGIATCAIFSFIMSWNEFFYALILAGRSTRTAPVVIQSFISFEGINWGNLAAAGILVTIPVLLFSLVVQRGLIRGLVAGALD